MGTLTLDDLTIGQGATNSKFLCVCLKSAKFRSFLQVFRFKKRGHEAQLSG
jgi:hypothetical protein